MSVSLANWRRVQTQSLAQTWSTGAQLQPTHIHAVPRIAERIEGGAVRTNVTVHKLNRVVTNVPNHPTTASGNHRRAHTNPDQAAQHQVQSSVIAAK